MMSVKYYPTYFIPNEVANQYKQHIHGGKDLTVPIIKRKVSAMIYATKYNRKQLENGYYYHKFGHVEIIVDEKNHKVKEIKYTIISNNLGSDGKFYDQLCKLYRLNNKHNNFAPWTVKSF